MRPLKKNPAIAALIVIVLIGLAAGAVVLINKERHDNDADGTTSSLQNNTPSTSTSTSSSSTDSNTQYKDGTYTKSANYISPGGRESVTVGVTIKNGVVTDSTFSATASDRDAREYQSMFSGSYKSQVVGKSVNAISLSRVAGASLTTNAFNDALDHIKSDAKA